MVNQQLPMVEICANGQVLRYQSTLTSIRSISNANKLSSRDVRLLRSSAPVLAPRPGYILFDLGELRGLLQHDRLILIGADLPAVGALGAEIQRRLEAARADDAPAADEAPFEIRALECMLEQTYSVFEETLQTLSALVQSTLRDLTAPGSGGEGRREAALSKLLPLRISLSALQARSRRVSLLLDEILDSEDDVSDMCLTFLRSLEPPPPLPPPTAHTLPPTSLDTPSLSTDQLPAARRPTGPDSRYATGPESRDESDDADESMRAARELLYDSESAAAMLGLSQEGSSVPVPMPMSAEAEEAAAVAEAERAEEAQDQMETLLDVYDARLNSVVDQIEQLASTIENTQDVLELTLDNERNRIARLELLLSMAGLSVGTCSAVSGFFGMNLLSGLEATAGLFALVTGVSILLTGSVFVTCWRQFRSISTRQRDRLMDVDALKNVLAQLDLVALLLRNRPPLPTNAKSMREEVRQLLAASAIRMNARELGVLCHLLQQQATARARASSQGLDAARTMAAIEAI